MKPMLRAALCAASLVAVAVPAGATTIIVTYTGKVNSGTDVDGLFGTAGANLRRQDFTLSFTTDTSGFSSDGIEGEYSSIQYCCSVQAIMTIGGQSYIIDGIGSSTYVAQWAFVDWSYGYQIGAQATAANGNDFANANIGSFDDFFGALGLTTPLTRIVSNDDDAYSVNFSAEHTYLGDLRLSSVSVEVIPSAPVPEPASWALMVGGFGLVGGALRSRPKTRVRFV